MAFPDGFLELISSMFQTSNTLGGHSLFNKLYDMKNEENNPFAITWIDILMIVAMLGVLGILGLALILN